MSGSIASIRDVAEKHLCTGCGICAHLAPDTIRMVDDVERGRRPLVNERSGSNESESEAAGERDALEACPGWRLGHDDPAPEGTIDELLSEWGPVLEVWEGHAADDALRFAGSSGGAASALALFGIERGGLHGVLHIAARDEAPWLNETVLSTTRDELLERTGSRYAPASPCDGLDRVVDAPVPCVFIGKPCDVAATRKARRLRPELDEKLGITIAIFCAGTPSTRATIEMMKALGATDPEGVRSLRYRGNGWPGMYRVESEGSDGPTSGETTYAKSWHELQKRRQWRCYVCADHVGEFADIAVGDPWYREIPDDEPGLSLVIPRTERGRRFLADAMAAGYLELERREPDVLVRSQPGLQKTRGAIWGRILVTRLLGAAAPRYYRMPMFPSWLRRLTFKEKLSSLLGTARRTFKKGLRHPVQVVEWTRDRWFDW